MGRQLLTKRRDELGMSRTQAAQKIGVSERTYRRWEQGESTPQPWQRSDIARVMDWSMAEVAAAIDNHTAPTRQEVVDRLSWYANLEQSATLIRSFEPFTVHALLQTRAYATAVESIGPEPVNNDSIARLVEVRISRQDALTRTVDPVQFSIVLDESVLRRTTGGHAVMAEQLEHLASMAADRPNIQMWVLPLDAGVHSAGWGSFTVLTLAQSKQMTCIEDRTGFSYLDRPDAIDAHLNLFDHLCDHAVPPGESPDVIRTIAKEMYDDDSTKVA